MVYHATKVEFVPYESTFISIFIDDAESASSRDVAQRMKLLIGRRDLQAGH